MAINYDAWLEEPYQRMCADEETWFRAEEEWLESDHYKESLAEWLEENPSKTEDDYQQSQRFQNGVQSVIDNWSREQDECLIASYQDW